MAALMLGVLGGCGSDSGTDPVPDGPTDSAWVSSEGGTVTDSYGSSVMIPAGALDADTYVEVSTHLTIDDLPDSLWFSLMDDQPVAEFLPHDTEFSIPATITIPLGSPATPGTRAPLLYWNEDLESWEETEFMGVVNADGTSCSAEVTHFSSYTYNMPQGEGGLFGDFDVENAGGLPAIAFSNWQAIFRHQVRDLGHEKCFKNCCVEVTGLLFRMQRESGGSPVQNLVDEVGDIEDFTLREIYTHRTGTYGSGEFLMLQAIVYWKPTDPSVRLTTEHNVLDLESGPTTSWVDVFVSCKDMPIKRSPVTFHVNGPGSVNPTTAITDARGLARTTYVATEEGPVEITAEVTSCNELGESQVTSGSTEIRVKNLGEYYLAVEMTFLHETGVWTFSDYVAMYIPLHVDDQGVVTTPGAQGGHSRITVVPEGNASIIDLTAPAFTLATAATITDGTLRIQIAPQNLLVSFTYVHETDPPVSFPVYAYSNMEATIIAQQLDVTIPFSAGKFVSGSGTELFDADPPAVVYTWKVTVSAD